MCFGVIFPILFIFNFQFILFIIMQTKLHIPVENVVQSRISEVDFSDLGFAKWTSDHMFTCTWSKGGWQHEKIVPYGDMSVSPSMLSLHYGQTVFEGMKAYRTASGAISIFRLSDHHARFNRSLERMSMPSIPYELFASAIEQLVSLDAAWVPDAEGSSLYIRPFVFASEARMGVKVSDEYRFMVITAPSGPYYAKPLSVKAERTFVRAAEGGTGYAKCGGNYGASFYPTALAQSEGYDQVIWTDACSHNYIEEAGTMNLMFVINGTLLTPPVSTSVLSGITRDSILKICEAKGLSHEVRRISLDEIRTSLEAGTLTEAFGAGTAAVVAPITRIGIDGKDYTLGDAEVNHRFMQIFKQELNGIRRGQLEDVWGWNTLIGG
jgi:branched-chain amino acid aminotransferase